MSRFWLKNAKTAKKLSNKSVFDSPSCSTTVSWDSSGQSKRKTEMRVTTEAQEHQGHCNKWKGRRNSREKTDVVHVNFL